VYDPIQLACGYRRFQKHCINCGLTAWNCCVPCQNKIVPNTESILSIWQRYSPIARVPHYVCFNTLEYRDAQMNIMVLLITVVVVVRVKQSRRY